MKQHFYFSQLLIQNYFNARRPLLLSSGIYPEDERSETVAEAIVDTIQEKAELIEGWRTVHESMFNTSSHDIPDKSEMDLNKAREAAVTADTCNQARLVSEKVAAKIDEAIEAVCLVEGRPLPHV